jgi:hypothetical protein
MISARWTIVALGFLWLTVSCSGMDFLGDLVDQTDQDVPDMQVKEGELDVVPMGDLFDNLDLDETWELDGNGSDGADETDLSLSCQPGDGCFLDSCSDNSECQSGWCVEHMGEGVCTQACQEECPPGWTCQTTGGTGPDMMSICLSNFANLCKPCATTQGCESAGGAEDVCLDYGIEGSFCGGGCAADEDCPWGFLCQEADSIDGVTLKQCVAESGVCPCSQKSVELGLSTPCAVTSEFGSCSGKRVCTEDGLSDCDALVPGLEVCNGIDDNCDDDVDEASFVDGKYVDLCNDGNDCTDDLCHGDEGCEHVALDGVECKDGNPCTVADVCIEGVCVGSQVDCDDENPCTDDFCNDTGGCVFEANSGTCDDGNPCTVADQCKDQECVGYDVPCDCQEDTDCGELEDGDLCNGTLSCDKSELPYKCAVVLDSVIVCEKPSGFNGPCLESVCEPETGACDFSAVNDGGLCEDGDKCSVGDTCQEGICASGVAANCNDGNLCTDDSCDLATGCLHIDNALPCSDENVCTVGDLCTDGQCLAGPEVLACDDLNPCTEDTCHPLSGCVQTANNESCDDGNACTESDYCAAGNCKGGPLLVCDDNNPCTDDSCDSVGGCIFGTNVAPCDDGDPCTLNDKCGNGACSPGASVDCHDDNPCTLDSCGPDGLCTHLPQEGQCSDYNKCTSGDHCDAGECVYDSVDTCDDGDVCTTDSCNPVTGCSNQGNSGPCDDKNPCTLNDKCDNGVCISGPGVICDDGNSCTDDSCGGDGICLYTDNDQLTCDDGNDCTLGDHCQEGVCSNNGLADCDDDNVCTTDGCDPGQGCIHLLNQAPCSDGDICTTADKCNLGACSGGPDLACSDGNPCTDDSCAPDNGCQFLPNSAACDDGNACTVDEGCVSGSCKPGGMKDCNDGNPCTNDSCDVIDGCVYSFNTAPCDDEDECTVGEKCELGVCTGDIPPNCNDGDICTDDVCVPGAGCVHTHNNAPCSDGNACTDGDVCALGVCTPGGALECDDVNVCTTDSCEPVTGCVQTPVDGSCEDGDQCTENDYCVEGECHAGDAAICDDSNVCTDDDCIPDSGCHFVSNVALCDDNDACTDGDVCNGGSCQSGDAIACDDSKVCTTDTCEPAQGCLYTPVVNYTSCGPGIEVCIAGECVDCPNPTGTKTFNYTGGQQTWVVPACVVSVTVEVWGAQGGGSNGGEDGGLGGYAKGTLAVTAGETLYLYVGGKGQNQSSGGWNGGGDGAQYGGGGGGGTDIRQAGTSLHERVVVGGGGAGGQTGGPDHGWGGNGGGLTGATGGSNQGWTAGGGGSQNGGGSAGSKCSAGSFGLGGSNASYHVSGGGGGWYGGGCSYAAGGGGGSAYYGGCTNGSTQAGNRSGHGMAKISW